MKFSIIPQSRKAAFLWIAIIFLVTAIWLITLKLGLITEVRYRFETQKAFTQFYALDSGLNKIGIDFRSKQPSFSCPDGPYSDSDPCSMDREEVISSPDNGFKQNIVNNSSYLSNMLESNGWKRYNNTPANFSNMFSMNDVQELIEYHTTKGTGCDLIFEYDNYIGSENNPINKFSVSEICTALRQ